MNNPYEAPDNLQQAERKPRRTGIWLLLVIMLMFGGCAVAAVFYLSVPVAAPAPGPAPVSAQPAETPAQTPAE